MEIPKKRIRALVKCKNGIQHPGINFEVTLDPERVWLGTSYIRFGAWSGDKKGQADELTGWMNVYEWDIACVLGEVDEEGVVHSSHVPPNEVVKVYSDGHVQYLEKT